MQKENQTFFQEQNSWFNCIGDIQQYDIQQFEKDCLLLETEVPIDENKEIRIIQNTNFNSLEHNNLSDLKKNKLKRTRLDSQNEKSTLNNSQQKINASSTQQKEQCKLDTQQLKIEKQKQAKHHIYSKNYRQRKKQHYKILEEQNDFLKKKVNQLQCRLRQKQLQINRLKFIPQQKQLAIEQLNELFLKQVSIMMEKNKDDPVQYRDRYEPKDQFYKEFQKTYSQHGFGGSRKLEIIEYYFNQIMESVLRDSEKYFCMMCSKAKDGESIQGFSQYEQINWKLLEVLQPNQDRMQRLKHFQVNLHPMVNEFSQSCKQFYMSFQHILKSIERIHLFMKNTYTSNMDLARKRILRLQPWFEEHKYDKMMRNMRTQWLQFIRSPNHTNQHKKREVLRKKRVHDEK